MQISEDQLTRWAKAPSETEEGKCQNAVRIISEAIQNHFGSDVSVFLQGSYRNRTNVRQDSDVDIVVLHEGYYFPNVNSLSEAEQRAYWDNFTGSSYTFQDYKTEVLSLMNKVFGAHNVTRKNKCIRVNGNDNRVHADVVPCFVHKRLRSGGDVEAEGVEFAMDQGGERIFSFPKQHYDNGTSKNKNTKEMYKPVVRILKNVRNVLVDEGTLEKDLITSFFLECLTWNVLPHTHFHENNYADATRNILVQLYEDMGDAQKANEYAEVSDLKWLFRGNSRFTHQHARNFAEKAWNHIGYEN